MEIMLMVITSFGLIWRAPIRHMQKWLKGKNFIFMPKEANPSNTSKACLNWGFLGNITKGYILSWMGSNMNQTFKN